MNRAEIAARHAGYLQARRRHHRTILVLMPAVIVILLAALVLMVDPAKSYGEWLLAVPLLLMVGVMLGAARRDPQNRPAEFKLLCPHCAKGLLDHAAHVAVATGICPHCAIPIAQDSLDPPGEPWVKATARSMARLQRVTGLLVHVLLVIVMVAAAGFFVALRWQRLWLATVAAMVCTAAGLGLDPLMRALHRRSGLICPVCQGELGVGPPGLLLVTASCPWCATRLEGGAGREPS